MFQIESRIDLEEAEKTAGQKGRAYQQRQRNSELPDHHGVEEPGAMARARSTRLQRVLRGNEGGLDRRSESGENPGEQSGDQADYEDTGIHGNFTGARKRHGTQQLYRP